MSRASEAPSSHQPPRAPFTRVFELTGVVPLLAYAVSHLLHLSWAAASPERFEEALRPSTLRFVLELLLVWAPLTFHTLFGLWVVFSGRGRRQSGARSWLSRGSAWVLVVFIVVHVVTLRVARARGVLAEQDVFFVLVAQLSSTTTLGLPLWALGYTVGVTALAVHTGMSLRAFAEARGWERQPRLRPVTKVLPWVVGLGLLLWGIDVVAVYATGSHFWLSAV